MTEELGFEIHLNEPYDQAVEKVVAALKEEGFGVLTRIDVRAVMKEKLGQEFRPYVILGACNPALSHQALSSEPLTGLMLPCNVTVEADPQGGSLARIANPEVMMEVGALGDNPAVREVGRTARQKLERAAQALKTP